MKRFLPALLAAALLLGLVSGCAPSEGGVTAADENAIIDSSGAVLEIPENAGETTIASVYAVAVPFIVALDLPDRVVAVNVKSKFWTDAGESLAAAGSVGRGTVDLEALAELSPGVLIHRSSNSATVEAVSGKLGIDVLYSRGYIGKQESLGPGCGR